MASSIVRQVQCVGPSAAQKTPNRTSRPSQARSNIISFLSSDAVLKPNEHGDNKTNTIKDLMRSLGSLEMDECPSETHATINGGNEKASNSIGSSATPDSTDILALVGLTAAVSCICSLDRSAMSVAILPMSAELHWDASTQGAISSAFFLGYTVTNLAGGYLATRWCPKAVLAMGVLIWSLFTIITPMAAASGSLPALLAVRGVMGIGEGVAYPSIQNLVREAVPSVARSRAISFISSGHQMGTIASYMTAPGLISSMGWQSVFEIFGSFGFLWLLGWGPLVKLAAEQRKEAEKNKSKRAAGAKGPVNLLLSLFTARQSDDDATSWSESDPSMADNSLRVQDMPWGVFVSSSPFWAIVAAQATVGIGACLSFAWLPTFYSETYNLDVASSASFCVVPTLATIAATNVAGWMADEVISRNLLSKTHTRKVMQAVGSLGPAGCLLYLASMSSGNANGSPTSLTEAVSVVTAWLALGGFSAAGFGSNHQDLSARYAGVLFGISNGVGSIAGSASIYLTGIVLRHTHNWSMIFSSTAAMYIAGATLYLTFASAEDQKFDEATGSSAQRSTASSARMARE